MNSNLRDRRRWARVTDEALSRQAIGVLEVSLRAKVGRSTVYRLLAGRPTNSASRAAIARALRLPEKDLTS